MVSLTLDGTSIDLFQVFFFFSKGFKVIRDLERHHNRPNTKYFHSEEYLSLKHICPEDGCCRRFKRERALMKHMLIHNNIRNFKCDHCAMAFCTRQVS